MNAIEEFEAQEALEPGIEGWWKVYGAGVSAIQAGDIVLLKNQDDSVTTVHIADTFRANAYPMRHGFVGDDGAKFTLGALNAVTVIRRGTHNTLAS